MPRQNSIGPPAARMRQIRADIVRPDPSSEAAGEPERARDEDGQFVGDDPATPAVNEAYVGGKAPAKRSWNPKDNKATLLKVAKKAKIKGLSKDNTKAEIIEALEKAGL